MKKKVHPKHLVWKVRPVATATIDEERLAAGIRDHPYENGQPRNDHDQQTQREFRELV